MADQNVIAYQALAAADPVLRQLIERIGRPDPFDWAARDFPYPTDFEAMALHIVIPESILALSEDELRSCGLSRAKAGYLHGLARRQAEDQHRR